MGIGGNKAWQNEIKEGGSEGGGSQGFKKDGENVSERAFCITLPQTWGNNRLGKKVWSKEGGSTKETREEAKLIRQRKNHNTGCEKKNTGEWAKRNSDIRASDPGG